MEDVFEVALDYPPAVKQTEAPRSPLGLPAADDRGAVPLLLQVREELRQVLREEHQLLRDWTTSWGRGQQQHMEEYTQSLLRQIEKNEKKEHGNGNGNGSGKCSVSIAKDGMAGSAEPLEWSAVVPMTRANSNRISSASFAGALGCRSPAPAGQAVPPTPTSPPNNPPTLERPRHPFEVMPPATEERSPSPSEDEMVSNWDPEMVFQCGQGGQESHRHSMVSDDASKEMDREEWTAHLRRRVSQQLTKKDFPVLRQLEQQDPGVMGKLVEHHVFQFVCASMIVVNAVFAGYTSDVSMSCALAIPSTEDPAWFKSVNSVFTAWFCVEIVMRIVACRKLFFIGPDWRWNALDSVLVLSSVVEEIFQDVGLGSLRVIRGLRMFRVLRIIRVMRFFRDLRLMVCSVMQSLASLSWALLLLLIIMYLFTVFFMQGAIIHFREEHGTSATAVRQGIDLYYSTVFDTMYTLLGAITGGVNWVDVVRPLEEISFIYRCLFAFYIVFVVVGVLNVLTGIFVERANELSGLDKDLVIQSEMKRNETFLAEMKRIFEEADADGSGTISWDEFKGYLKNDRVKAYLATQQLDAFDARTLFDILNVGEGGEIGIDQFIVGCMRLKGMAKSVDLVAVLQETRAVGRRIKALTRELEKRDTGFRSFPSATMNQRRHSRSFTTGNIESTPRSFTTGALG